MSDDTIKDAIEENATGPRRASGDSGSVEQHPIPDQIAGDKHIASKAASRATGFGIRLLKIKPGGSI